MIRLECQVYMLVLKGRTRVVVVRALAFRQCSLGSIPRLVSYVTWVYCCFSFCSEGFPPGSPVFLHKNQHFLIPKLDLEKGPHEIQLLLMWLPFSIWLNRAIYLFDIHRWKPAEGLCRSASTSWRFKKDCDNRSSQRFVKLISIKKLCSRPQFETEAKGISEITYLLDTPHINLNLMI